VNAKILLGSARSVKISRLFFRLSCANRNVPLSVP
jgi:hypothetical protein